MASRGWTRKRLAGSFFRACGAMCLAVVSLVAVAPSSALTLDSFRTRFEGNVAGDFALTGNTVLTCSTAEGALGANTCASARKREGTSVDNDDHFMRNIEVPVGGLPAAAVFNSSANMIQIPAQAQVIYAELFWSGSLFAEPGDVEAVAPSDKAEVLMAVGDDNCAAPGHPCVVTANATDVSQETLGSALGQYRASAVVTSRLAEAHWTPTRDLLQSLITVGNVQTTQGVDKAAGWSLAVVFASPGHEMRHVQVLGGFGFIARRSGATIPLDGFLTPSNGDVSSSVGLIAFDGDLGDTTDSMYLRQGSGQTIIDDAQNPELNIANSTVSSSGELSNYLTDESAQRASNTFGVDIDRIDLNNALGHGSTQATLVLSTQQDTWYPTSVAYSTELPSADVSVLKFVSALSGAPVTHVNVGDSLTYTLRVHNAGNGSASHVIIRDEMPADLTVTSSSGSDCATVPAGYVCKVIDTLPAGALTDITITGTVNGASQLTSSLFTNQADVKYASHLGDNTAVSNIVTTEYGPLTVDLRSELAFTSDYVQAGEDSTLVASISNLGPSSDENPFVELLITDGRTTVPDLPAGCEQKSATRIICLGAAFGISNSHPLNPGESKTVHIRMQPDSEISRLVIKQIVHTGVAGGDSNLGNNISYAGVDVNHRPVAKPLMLTARMGGSPVTSSLAMHVTDPDSDALHIRVAQATHGELLQLGMRISYIPPKNWSGVQRISYTVSDGKGGQAQSHITIVVTRPTPQGHASQEQDTSVRKCVVIRAGC